VAGWLQAVTARAAQAQGSLGSVYTQRLTAAQQDWIRAQAWYAGREVPHVMAFNTCCCFVVTMELIRLWDWHGPGLRHRGGDITLGALLHQQGLAPQQFRVGLAINADEQLRESDAERRGDIEAPDAHLHTVWGPEP
jgi:hypothetical protein